MPTDLLDRPKRTDSARAIQHIAPKVNIGDIVLHFPHGDKTNGGVPAVVMENRGHALTLHVLANSNRKAGCHHVEDPWLKDHLEACEATGGWDITDSARALLKLFKREEDLHDKDVLEGMKGKLVDPVVKDL